jgi:myosin heavy subunit
MNIAGYITAQQAEEIVKNYFQREGRELILEILKEHMIGLNINSKNELDNNLEINKEKEEKKELIKFSGNKIKLDSEIVRKKEAIQDFVRELEKYDEKERVEVKVGQLKECIIKVFGLNEELEENRKNHLKEIKKLEVKKEELERDLEKLKDEYSESISKIESLNDNIADLTNTKNSLGKEVKEKEEDIDRKEREIIDLESENNRYMKNIEALKGEKKELIETIESKKIELERVEKENRELNKKVGKLDGVEELSRLYENYLKVSEGYRDRLKRLIKDDNVSSFIACCYNIGTMDDLWDSLNVEVRNGNLADAYILRDIFEYFVAQQNKKYDESLYKLLIPTIGEEFDPTKHMAINGSSSGKIEEVIFPGYGNMESKASPDQTDEERKFKKVRKLAMVRVR